MQHAMATKMTNIWHYAERHEQWKRVTLPACILKMYCRPGATAENMIQPITGLQSSSIPVRRFPKKLHRSTYLYIYMYSRFLYTSRFQVVQIMFGPRFSHIFEDLAGYDQYQEIFTAKQRFSTETK